METKACTKCGEVRPKTAEYFNRQSASKDGLNRWCKGCTRNNYKKWSLNNPDYIKHRNKKYKENNKEYIRQQWQVWYQKNRDDRLTYHREYTKNHLDEIVARNSLKRADKIKATPEWADQDEIRYIYSLAKEKGLVVDHIVPLTSDLVCGLHTGDNLRCIPAKLNSHKGNRYWPNM